MAKRKPIGNVAKLAQEIAVEHAQTPIVYGLFDFVLWRNKKCIVTNCFKGRKITISPMGNGKGEAQYFDVYPDEVRPYDENVAKNVTEK